MDDQRVAYLKSLALDIRKDILGMVHRAGEIGVAAGLAVCGKTVFVSAIANFATLRCFEQIRTDLAYPFLNVKVVGMSAGFSYPYLGPTHVCTEELALMRAVPNMTVICPADSAETVQVVQAAAAHPGPMYIRLGRQEMPDIHGPDYVFRMGLGTVLRHGNCLALFCTGTTVHLCLEASRKLEDDGIQASVISLSTVKPIDSPLIVDAARRTGIAMSVEEHNLIGGLGSAVAEVLSEECPVPLKRLGVPDVFPVPGPRDRVMARYGLSADMIARTARQFLEVSGG